MADPASNEPVSPSAPANDAAPSPLAHVVDDYLPRYEAFEWAIDELAKGRTFESVTAELVAGGWGLTDADEIVEDARRATRSLRNATTRDQILRESNRRYRASMHGRWFVGFPTVATVMRLIHALGSLASLRRRKHQVGEGEATPDPSQTCSLK